MDNSHILNKIVNIIYNNPDFFRISRVAIGYYEQEKDEMEANVKRFISNCIEYVFNKKLKFMEEFWWVADPKKNDYEMLQRLLVISVLSEFANTIIFPQDRILWDNITQNI